MARVTNLGNIFKTLREADLGAIRRSAEEPLHLALVGEPGAGKTTLIHQMRSGRREGEHLPVVTREHDLPAVPAGDVTAVVLVLDASRPTPDGIQPVIEQWRRQGVPVLVCLNKADLVTGSRESLMAAWTAWAPVEVVLTSALQQQALMHDFVPAVLRLVPGRELALARALPLFRQPVTQQLIENTAFTNASYSLTTGLVEIIPALDIPFNVTDMVMLTKNQAIMAYKIALALGLPADWRETLPQLAAVVGGGFLWRQIARQLVGLVPAWGLVPKVAVAYAGTRVTGLAVYHWAATGEKLTPEALKALYGQALNQGRDLARRLISRRRERPAVPAPRTCSACGRSAPPDATFCPYCGMALAPALAVAEP